MAFQAGYAYPVGKVLTKHYQFEKIEKPGGHAQITMDGNQATRLWIDRRGRALRRGLSDHAVVVGHGNLAERAAEIRRNFCAGRGRARRGFDRARIFVFRISRGYRQRRPGHFAQSRSDRLGVNGGDPAHHLQHSTRRPEHGLADQR